MKQSNPVQKLSTTNRTYISRSAPVFQESRDSLSKADKISIQGKHKNWNFHVSSNIIYHPQHNTAFFFNLNSKPHTHIQSTLYPFPQFIFFFWLKSNLSISFPKSVNFRLLFLLLCWFILMAGRYDNPFDEEEVNPFAVFPFPCKHAMLLRLWF